MIRILLPERTRQIALAWSILNDCQLAEDAYQDTLAKAFENEAIFETPQHLCAWSWKVLRHRCYELIRKGKSREVLLDEVVLELVDAELESRDVDGLDTRAEALRQCLDVLTDNARTLIHLRFFEGIRGKQVAEMLGRKPDAIYKALQRIYVTLAGCINRKTVELEKERLGSQ